jgi:hypothetical protein
MNAFNTVNLAAACIVTSAGHARSLQIPESNWIYPLSGAGSAEDPDCKSPTAKKQIKLP